MSELINSLNCSITSSAIAIVILFNAFTIVSDFDDSNSIISVLLSKFVSIVDSILDIIED